MTIPPLPSISLRADNDEVIYRQLYHRFRDAIVNGSYPPGTRVPSIRTLAQQLNVSRNTVERAYDLLVGYGYFIAQGQAGTFVSTQFSQQQGPVQPLPERPAPPSIQPFQIGVPAQDAFPRKLWSALSQAHLKDPRNIDLHSASGLGYEPLRSAIAAPRRDERSGRRSACN